jgi:hypothetical protein
MADYNLNDLINFFSDEGMDTNEIARQADEFAFKQGDLLADRDAANEKAKNYAKQYVENQTTKDAATKATVNKEQKKQEEALAQFVKNLQPTIAKQNPIIPTVYSYPGPVSNEDISTFPAYTPILPPLTKVDEMLKLNEPAPTQTPKPESKAKPKPVSAKKSPEENLPELMDEEIKPEEPEITPEKPLSDIEAALLQANKNREQANRIDAISQLVTGMVGLNRPTALKYDDSAAKMLREQANIPVEDLKKTKESEKSDINLKAAKFQLADETQQRDPNSEISKALRKFILDQGSVAGMKGLVIPEGLSYKSLEGMYGHITDVFNAKLKSDTLKESIRQRQQDKQFRISEQVSAQDEKSAKLLQKDLDPNMNSRGNMAKNQARIDAAERLEALAVEKDGQFVNLTPQQMNELASGLDTLISSNPSISGREHLTPESKSKWIANRLQWLTDNPRGADQIAFTANMVDTIRREKEVAQGQIRRVQKERLAAHKGLKQRNPNLYNDIISSYGLVDEEETEVIISPNGKPVHIPKSEVEAALKAGGKRPK